MCSTTQAISLLVTACGFPWDVRTWPVCSHGHVDWGAATVTICVCTFAAGNTLHVRSTLAFQYLSCPVISQCPCASVAVWTITPVCECVPILVSISVVPRRGQKCLHESGGFSSCAFPKRISDRGYVYLGLGTHRCMNLSWT